MRGGLVGRLVHGIIVCFACHEGLVLYLVVVYARPEIRIRKGRTHASKYF